MLEYMTLGEMVSQVGTQIQDTSSTKAEAIKDWVNTHYAQMARSHRWPELLRISEEKFSTTAGASYLYLPKEVEELYIVFPQNGMPPLLGQSLDQLIQQYSTSYDTSGLAVNFSAAGEVGYRAAFYTAGERLTITHSGSGTIDAVVRGLVSGAEGVIAGTETVEAVSVLQGSGGTTTNTFTDLGAVSVQELSSGDVVTVVGVTSGTTYAVIGTGERVALYKRIRLFPPTQSADTVTIVWKKRVARLIDDNQAIEIPVGPQLLDAVVSTMLSNQREYGGANLHYQRAQSELAVLKTSNEVDTNSITQAIPGTRLTRGYRQGGSGY